MRKYNIVCVGKIKEQYLRDGIAEYVKRLSRYAQVSIKELDDYSTSSDVCIEKESEQILSSLSGYVIALDIGGKQLKSEEIASLVDKAFITNSEITFVIGGSRGYNDSVRKRADVRLSFGLVTYPHQLMRMILLEQLYRAETILNNTPYHK